MTYTPAKPTAPKIAAIGIIAHVARLRQAEKLAETVGADCIAVDDGALGCEANEYRAYRQLARQGLPWTVLLEDDAVPVDDFTGQLHGVLCNAPNAIVSLYLGRSRPPVWQNWIRRATVRAEAEQACFIESSRLLHTVGVAIHTRLIGSMLAQTRHLGGIPIDEAISAWARHQTPAIRVSYCWPSIVDHLDGPTLIVHPDGQPRDTGRIAWAVGTRSRWHPTQIPE